MTQTCRSCHRPFHIAGARFCPLCGASVADPRQTILHHPPLQRPAADPRKSDPAATLLFGADPSTAIRAELQRQEQLAVADTVRPQPVADAVQSDVAETPSRKPAAGKARQNSVATTVRIDPVAPGVAATSLEARNSVDADEEPATRRESSPFTPSQRASDAVAASPARKAEARADSNAEPDADANIASLDAAGDEHLAASDSVSPDDSADSLAGSMNESRADAAADSAVLPFDDDEPLMVPRRSYRNLMLAAGAAVLLIGALSVFALSGSHGAGEQADDSEAQKAEKPALVAPPAPASDVATPASETAAAPGEASASQPVDSELATATSSSSDTRSHRRRSSRRSRSSASSSRSDDASADQTRLDPTSFLDGAGPSRTAPATAPPATSPAPAPAPSPAPIASAPSRPASSGDQPIDPFADRAPARKPASTEEPIDPFGPGDSGKSAPRAGEEPIDPFPSEPAPPRGEQPIDPFAESAASGPTPASTTPAPAEPAVTTPAVPENSDDDGQDDEKRAAAFVKQGKAHLAASRNAAAQASFARALGLDPHNMAALEGLAAARRAE